MTGILDLIKSNIGEQALEQVSQQVGGNKEATQRAMAAAIPMLLSALQKNSKSRSGAEALAGALERDHDGGILGNLGSMLGQSKTQSMGEQILGHVLGQRQQNVSNQLGKATGLDSADVGKILANLAPVVMGAVGKVKRENNLGVSGLQDMLKQERKQIKKQQPNLSFLERALDSDGDGDVDLSDVMKQGSGLLSGFFKR
ncbi:DUF937 domain-containing protein [Marinicella sp. S1101]|uniref:DUF937 domain-containing protein n=1 Tax=Marinicella marina TaxID=2996016 RepID=UPI002260C475|nr:DUF937 domain-containing protein [Marinicella marina]MCX7552457.1 DUF937 domain-containing protein [Marinicella marina]MDJ1139333.1 DUF937 domain-containing protein [Marinicella marina]